MRHRWQVGRPGVTCEPPRALHPAISAPASLQPLSIPSAYLALGGGELRHRPHPGCCSSPLLRITWAGGTKDEASMLSSDHVNLCMACASNLTNRELLPIYNPRPASSLHSLDPPRIAGPCQVVVMQHQDTHWTHHAACRGR